MINIIMNAINPARTDRINAFLLYNFIGITSLKGIPTGFPDGRLLKRSNWSVWYGNIVVPIRSSIYVDYSEVVWPLIDPVYGIRGNIAKIKP